MASSLPGGLDVKLLKPLFLEVLTEGVEVRSPLLAQKIRIPLGLASRVLELADVPNIERDQLDKELPRDLVRALEECGFLTDEEPKDVGYPWQHWGSIAWSFQSATENVRFLERGTEAMSQWQADLEAESPPPPASLERRITEGPTVWLPRALSDPDVSYWHVLRQRRTHRQFLDEPMSLDQFASVMHATFGAQRFVDAHELGVLELRAPVSGGARHETMACVAVLNVQGLRPGLYIYSGIQHTLTWIAECPSTDLLNSWTANQGFFTNAAFGAFTVTDTAKMAWKYREARAYRHMQQNVGAYAQVFSMTCEAMGLGAAITGAITEAALEQALGLERPREIPMFALVAGFPVRGSQGMPPDVKVHGDAVHRFGEVDLARSVPHRS